ncbi:GLPGLI family protein [Aquimarina sp. M1]
MKPLLLPLIMLYFSVAKSQQMTVFYKEKRKPAQVSTRHAQPDMAELNIFMAEIAKIKASIKADKDRDSLDYYRKKIQEQANKISSHVRNNPPKPLDIPEYDFITVLKIGDKESLYYPQEKVGNDTISETRTNKRGLEFKRERINYNDSEIIYIDQSQKTKVSSIKVHEFDKKGRGFLIEEALENLQWSLREETKQIDNYVCHKAILQNSDKKVVAWYTKEFNTSAGPKGYHGLPGLILELKEGKKTVSFHKINLLSAQSMDINPPTEGEKITRQELNDLPSKLFNQY